VGDAGIRVMGVLWLLAALAFLVAALPWGPRRAGPYGSRLRLTSRPSSCAWLARCALASLPNVALALPLAIGAILSGFRWSEERPADHFRFLASGESNIDTEGALVGGIDVYRYAPDDPVALNKDWYAVHAASDGVLRVHGPIRNAEHWLNEVPARYKGIEVLGGAEPDTSRPRIAPADSNIRRPG
jgi:hypothetical protein